MGSKSVEVRDEQGNTFQYEGELYQASVVESLANVLTTGDSYEQIVSFAQSSGHGIDECIIEIIRVLERMHETEGFYAPGCDCEPEIIEQMKKNLSGRD